MRARSFTLSALAGVSLLSITLVTSLTPASAQTTPGNVSSFELQNADAREAIRDLFKKAGPGLSFTIDPAIQGKVTLSLQNVSFETALENLTRQVDATFMVENGVYLISPQAPGQAGPPQGLGGGGLGGGGFGGGGFGGGGGGFGGAVQAPQGGGESPVMTVDGDSLYILRRGMLYKVDKKAMKVVGQVAVGPNGPGGMPPGAPRGGGMGGFGGGGNGQP